MKTICWNVHGVGNLWTFKALNEVIHSNKTQLLFLSETKKNKMQVEKLKRRLRFNHCFVVESVGAMED